MESPASAAGHNRIRTNYDMDVEERRVLGFRRGHAPPGSLTRRRTRTGGFTLPEVMAALALLLIGAYAVFALLVISIQSDMESAHLAIARAFAQQELESVRSIDYSGIGGETIPNCGTALSILAQGTTISSNNATSVTTPTALPSGSGKLWIVAQNTGTQTGLVLATFQVTWTEPGRGADAETYATYIVPGGISSHT